MTSPPLGRMPAADQQGQSTPFIEFLLSALLQALREASSTDQVSDQVKSLLKCLEAKSLTALVCMNPNPASQGFRN